MEGWGVAGAVGISALPWTAHVCSQQAIALPGRKYLSGEELARDRSAPPPRRTTPIQLVFFESQSTYHLYKKWQKCNLCWPYTSRHRQIFLLLESLRISATSVWCIVVKKRPKSTCVISLQIFSLVLIVLFKTIERGGWVKSTRFSLVLVQLFYYY